MSLKTLGLLRRAQGFFVSLFLLLFLVPLSPGMAQENLGISVSVVPDSREDGLATGNGRLWFAMEPGESYARELTLRSSASVDQIVTLEFRDFGYNNGVRNLNSEPSIVNQWLTSGLSQVVVKAGESVNVPLRISAPADAPEQAFEGELVVLAGAADSLGEESTGEKVRVEVATQVAINIGFWVGVGAAENLYPMFDIRSLEGRIGEDGSKQLRVFFDNTGLIPLKLAGSVQFSSPTFEELTFGPYEFRTKDIPSGQIGYVDIDLSAELLEGPWIILVAAEQDGIKQTKLFEQDVSFSGSQPFGFLVPVIFVTALALFTGLGIVGLRLLRRKPTAEKEGKQVVLQNVPDPSSFESAVSRRKEERAQAKSNAKEPRTQTATATLLERPNSQSTRQTSEFDLELDNWAESLRSSIREVRSDSTDLVEKYKDVPTRKPRKPKAKD